MSDRVLRGSRLGAVSYESDRHAEPAPRTSMVFDCPNGHETQVVFSVEAEVPSTWECRHCGATALRRDAEQPEEKKGKPARTHWDMLLERRSFPELEEVLAERLQVLHEQRDAVEAERRRLERERKKSA